MSEATVLEDFKRKSKDCEDNAKEYALKAVIYPETDKKENEQEARENYIKHEVWERAIELLKNDIANQAERKK